MSSIDLTDTTSTGTVDTRLGNNTVSGQPYIHDPARVEAIRIRLHERSLRPLRFSRSAPDDIAYLLAQLGVR